MLYYTGFVNNNLESWVLSLYRDEHEISRRSGGLSRRRGRLENSKKQWTRCVYVKLKCIDVPHCVYVCITELLLL